MAVRGNSGKNFWFSVGAWILLFAGCSSSPIAVEEAAQRAALLAAQPMLEKIFSAQAPIAPSNRELYLTVSELPGGPFDPQSHFKNRILFSDGIVTVPKGYYIIPVMS